MDRETRNVVAVSAAILVGGGFVLGVLMRPLILLLAIAFPCLAADPEVATVQVRGPIGAASGAAVWTDGQTSLVVTNKHVAPHGLSRIEVRAGGKWHAAQWLGADEGCDVAVLRVSGKLEVLPLAAAEPAAGTSVRVYGYGGFPKSGKAIGSNGERYVGHGDAYHMTLKPEPGDSGAPLVTKNGEVVGLVWASHGDIGLAVRLNEVRAVVGKYAK